MSGAPSICGKHSAVDNSIVANFAKRTTVHGCESLWHEKNHHSPKSLNPKVPGAWPVGWATVIPIPRSLT